MRLAGFDIRRGQDHASEHCQKHLGALVTAKADKHPELSFEQASDDTPIRGIPV